MGHVGKHHFLATGENVLGSCSQVIVITYYTFSMRSHTHFCELDYVFPEYVIPR